MFLDSNASAGFSQFVVEYDRYVAETKAKHQRPVSMLAYLVEMFQ